jgi:hypothetical protein
VFLAPKGGTTSEHGLISSSHLPAPFRACSKARDKARSSTMRHCTALGWTGQNPEAPDHSKRHHQAQAQEASLASMVGLCTVRIKLCLELSLSEPVPPLLDFLNSFWSHSVSELPPLVAGGRQAVCHRSCSRASCRWHTLQMTVSRASSVRGSRLHWQTPQYSMFNAPRLGLDADIAAVLWL